MRLFKRSSGAVVLLAALVSIPSVQAQEVPDSITQPVESIAERNVRMAWWRDARFGMFIHWGVYAALAGSYEGKQTPGAGEWIMYNMDIPVAKYKPYSQKFNPVNYSPEQWVIMAKKAGMKYIVITSKHHEGFALFDSKVTDWDVVDATPYGKDLIAPLADACRKHGMKLGFYYSQAQDWNHPGGGAYKAKWDDAQKGDFAKYIDEIAIPQVREILSNYGDIAIIWWDTPAQMTPELAAPLYALAKELQPAIIMNNRLGGGFKGDSETPEQFIPSTGYANGRDWEVCMTLNKTWGYSEHDKNWKSPETVIKNLVDIVSKGGNYLINMGPKADGSIPEATVDCFREVGEWMHINGQAIYGTTASPFKKLSWGRCTKRIDPDGVTLYLHVFNWPEDGTLFLPGLMNEVECATTMWDPVVVKTKNIENGVLVKVPGRTPGKLERPEVLSLKLKGILQVNPVIMTYTDDNFVLNVSDAELNGSVKIEQKNKEDNIGFWTGEKDTVAWVFKVTKGGTFELASTAACEGDTVLEILLNGESKGTVSIPTTNGYTKFDAKVSLPTLELPPNKTITLTLRPVKDKWSPLNLRDIQVKKK